ncbi:unnamed protein product [Phytophthora fragariaefolia]|uniref:Unnamed protein product n=1 Tax=Phytophthora fragariaefolia TaxID=1490495 RepID=A0A9W6Y620_9STRA|nr:unnamed protein product [Phytophthora fragariaefolia]
MSGSCGQAHIWHPVAFTRTSPEVPQQWSNGVVSGYDVANHFTTHHVVCTSDSVRLPFSSTTPVIKADVLSYTLRIGAEVNTAAVTPTELFGFDVSIFSAPARPASLADVIGALSCFHKFAKKTLQQGYAQVIGVARDFEISYVDTASDDSGMARILTHWISMKFSKFRNQLVTKNLYSALRIANQFSRNDEGLATLR